MSRFNNSGKIVEHLKTGKRGRTFDRDGVINMKIPVYFETKDRYVFEDKAMLCSIENLKICGYID